VPDPRRWRRHPRILGLGGLAVAAVAAGLAVWATGASGTSGFRTAQATTADVRQTLGVSGTVDPVDQATVAFQVAGTVASVDVTAGQAVTAGQTLAALDPTTLEQNLSSAQSGLSSAQAKLAEDEDAQSGSGSTTTTTTVPSGPSATTAKLQQDQQAVVGAQQATDADTQQATSDLQSAQSTCATSGATTTTAPPSTTTTTTAPPSTTTTTTAPTTTTTTTTAPTSGVSDCTAALNVALSAQQRVATDQKAVSAAETALAQLLAASTGTGGSASAGSGSNTAGSNTASTNTASSGSGSGAEGAARDATTSAASDTPAQLASDQASIDTDEAAVIQAQAALADAPLVAPIAGTVAQVDLTAGQAVSAGSTTDVITVVSAGSLELSASLTSAQSTEVRIGDPVDVTVAGASGTLHGTVSRVGPVDDSDGTFTYPLVVALPAGSHGIAAGSDAQAQVVLHQVDRTLAVPTSAVSTTGAGQSSVTVLVGGREERKRVSLGVVGTTYTQILSGIEQGETVVLADLATPVPSSSTATNGFGGVGGTFTFGGGARQFTGGLAGGGTGGGKA
jgi:HlyD family secretion protein